MLKKDLARILVLDPNPLAQQGVQNLLAKESFAIDMCGQLVDAVRALKEEKFNCAIVDVQLPETPGYQAVPILKAIDPSLPIILTAEKNSRELESKVREQDVFYYYIKSFDQDELRLAVIEAVRASKKDGTPGTSPGML